jgi:transcriptional regulator with XRE-family HTH domain
VIGSQAELGQLVKLCREHRGLTQEELARQLDLGRTVVAHLEQGLRLPAPAALCRLCEHLGLPSVLWEGFIPRSGPHPISVQVRCRTYYTAMPERSVEEERRVRFVEAIRRGEPWQDGARVIADPYAACAKRQRKAFPLLFLNRTFVPVPPPIAADDGAEPRAPRSSRRLARAYAAEGTACRMVEQIRRGQELRKSGKSRVSVAAHLVTLVLTEAQVLPGVVLVDDVLGWGASLVACAARLSKLGWPGQVDALVVAYTRTQVSDGAEDGHVVKLGWDGKSDRPVRSG